MTLLQKSYCIERVYTKQINQAYLVLNIHKIGRVFQGEKDRCPDAISCILGLKACEWLEVMTTYYMKNKS